MRPRIKSQGDLVVSTTQKVSSYYESRDSYKKGTGFTGLVVPIKSEETYLDTARLSRTTPVRIMFGGKVMWVPYHRALGAGYKILGL